jgi:hypothetical protein
VFFAIVTAKVPGGELSTVVKFGERMGNGVMNVSQKQERLVLRDTPGSLWLAGAAFIFLATIFISKGVALLIEVEHSPLWVAGLVLLLGLFGLLAGVGAIMRNPMIAAEFNPERNLVEVRKQGLLPSQPVEVPLQYIAGVEVAEFQSQQGDHSYCLQLTTTNGQKIPLSATWTQGKKTHDDAALRIRCFLSDYGMSI